MSVLDLLLPPAHVTAFAAAPLPAPVAVAAAPAAADTGLRPVLRSGLEQINESVGMSIPAVRRAVHVIAGTISTFALSAWRRGRRLRPDEEPSWLHQPDPAKTLATTLSGTLRDAIWHDRCVWRIDYAGGLTMRRIQPDRCSITPDQYDPDLIDELTIDGLSVGLSRVIVFNWAGLGGLRRWGFELLDLYLALQTAAGRYAKAPHPKAILRNHGADLAAPEIEALLTQWEAQRETRSVGYLNDVVEYETHGWNAAELQLTEAREYAALEVARLFGLPAWAVDASGGDSMTYANVTDRRLDLVEALRPWMTPVEQTLSLDNRAAAPAGIVVPYGTTVQFDASAYTRDAPEARMRTWAAARAADILTTEEIRRVEPLADLAAGAPDQPTPGPPPASPPPAPAPAPPPGAPDA